jgi:hypothetical protein
MATALVVPKPVTGRSIHLIDVENLLGGPDFAELDVIELMAEYSSLVDRRPLDHVVIASCHRAAPATWFGCLEARRLVRSGPDGADLALVGVIEQENLAARYDRIVIGSGDGIFAEPAALLQTLGASVTVVAPVRGLSPKLKFAAKDIRFINVGGHPQAPTSIRDIA